VKVSRVEEDYLGNWSLFYIVKITTISMKSGNLVWNCDKISGMLGAGKHEN
jgi:hypothetical protein